MVLSSPVLFRQSVGRYYRKIRVALHSTRVVQPSKFQYELQIITRQPTQP